MKPLYLIAALAMMLAAAGLTLQLNGPAPRPADSSRLAADLANQRLPAPKAMPITDALVPTPLQGESAMAAVEHNLFHPSRRPPEPEKEQPEAPEASAPIAEETYTLVSVAQIGNRAVASIAVHEATAVTPPGAAPGRGRPPIPQKRPGTAAQAKGERALYQLGQKVGNSGYVLHSIELDRAVLKRGTETKELLIDAKSDESASRRESAAKAAPPSPSQQATIRTLADPFAAPASATAKPNSGMKLPGSDVAAPASGLPNSDSIPSTPPGVTAGHASRQSRAAAADAETTPPGAPANAPNSSGQPVDDNGDVFVMPPGGLAPPPPPGG